jgi:hypothetical protein
VIRVDCELRTEALAETPAPHYPFSCAGATRDGLVDGWAARISAAGLCVALLNAAANAQAPVLECSIGGEEGPASFTVDETTKTINTGKATLPAQMSAQTITWREDGVLRMIDRKTGTVLHRLPDGSHFQIGECRRLKR